MIPLRRRLAGLALLACAALAAAPSAAPGAPKVAVAAAANLVFALDALHAAFRAEAPDTVLTVTTGASGNLYAQIAHGAPFDVFLSADTEYPEQAVAAGLAPRASLRVFATGRLVLWTIRTDLDVADLAGVVRAPGVKRLALAQPRTAPYGRAAVAALEHLGLQAAAQPKLVLGESISQAAQFVETGSADAGFVALSLVRSPRLAGVGRWHEVPPAAYAGVSLAHAGVLTQRGARNPAAQAYLEFLSRPAAQKILRDFGYAPP